MSIVNKIEAVLETLATLSGSISDKYNSTQDILESLAQFTNTGLDNLVNEIEEIRDEVEECDRTARRNNRGIGVR